MSGVGVDVQGRMYVICWLSSAGWLAACLSVGWTRTSPLFFFFGASLLVPWELTMAVAREVLPVWVTSVRLSIVVWVEVREERER